MNWQLGDYEGERYIDKVARDLSFISFPAFSNGATGVTVNVTYSTSSSSYGYSSNAVPASFTVPQDARVDDLIRGSIQMRDALRAVVHYIRTHPVLAVHDRLDEANGGSP